MPIGRLAGVVTALLLALGVAACGASGGDVAPTADSDDRRVAPAQSGEPGAAPDDGSEADEPDDPSAIPDRVDPDDARVVRAWADTLRRGDVQGASAYFALPSLVSNGTAPIKLETRAQVEFFNRTLPCGASLIGTEPAPHGFLIATFRLTERPGRGRCGSGAGETARTAFRVRDALITDWLRVQDVESGPETLS